MHRSYAIREVETELHEARARAMMKQPQHPGRTEREYLEKWHLKVWHVVAVATAILAGIGILVGIWTNGY